MPSAANFRLYALMFLTAIAADEAVRAEVTAAAVVQAPAGPPPTAELAAKGAELYRSSCATCHGASAGGGPGGAPNLSASAIAMANDGGAQLAAFLVMGRPERGMPARPVTEEEALFLSAKLRSFGFKSTTEAANERVLVGDASAGKAFFDGDIGRCHHCHAVNADTQRSAADLSAIGAKYPDPKALQNAMVLPGRRWYWSPANSRDVTATLRFRDGRKVFGYLSSVSDFKVVIRDDAGQEQSFPRADGEPRVELQDRLQAHLDLLRRYKDNDIHDLTAYLATLR
jgi:cytochrome c oxidase cbb3-type subunit III